MINSVLEHGAMIIETEATFVTNSFNVTRSNRSEAENTYYTVFLILYHIYHINLTFQGFVLISPGSRPAKSLPVMALSKLSQHLYRGIHRAFF